MKNINDFLSVRKTASGLNKRLRYFIEQYLECGENLARPLKILDIGCGHNCELYKYKRGGDYYYGCDFFEQVSAKVDDYRGINLNEEKLTDKYKDERFDIIFCGEVMEHLFSPDSLMDEMKAILRDDGIIVLSTPNLGYFFNRIMLLFGIFPFFLENSSEVKLGRKFKSLGQLNPTEGHIKVFTYGALKDLIKLKGFTIIKVKSVSFRFGILDDIVGFLSKSLSANNIFVIKKI